MNKLTILDNVYKYFHIKTDSHLDMYNKYLSEVECFKEKYPCINRFSPKKELIDIEEAINLPISYDPMVRYINYSDDAPIYIYIDPDKTTFKEYIQIYVESYNLILKYHTDLEYVYNCKRAAPVYSLSSKPYENVKYNGEPYSKYDIYYENSPLISCHWIANEGKKIYPNRSLVNMLYEDLNRALKIYYDANNLHEISNHIQRFFEC